MNAVEAWHPGDSVVLWGVNVLVQLTVVGVAALAAARCLARQAAARHGVLCCGLLLMLLCPGAVAVLQSSGSGWLSVPLAGRTATAIVESPSPVADEEGRTSRRDMRGTPGAHRLPPPPLNDLPAHIPEPSAVADRNAHAPRDADRHDAALAAESSGNDHESLLGIAAVDPASSPVRSVLAVLLLIWSAGAAVLLGRILAAWVRLIRLVRQAEPITSPALCAALEETTQSLRMRRVPELLSSTRISGPFATGLRNSRIILPADLLQSLSPRAIHEILIHETAHVVRRDQLVVLLQKFAAALFWIHPVVHLVNRQLGRAREEVCDNYVLASTSAPAYSRTLLHLASTFTPAATLPCTAGLFTSRWTLESRVAGLLDDRRSLATRLPARGTAAVVALSMIAAGLALSATIIPARANGPDSQQATRNSERDSRAATSDAADGAAREPQVRRTTDALGDPLPDAAVLRLGTTRFRHPHGAYDIALSPDGRSVAAIGSDTLVVWNTATGEQRWQSRHTGRHLGMSAAAYGSRFVTFSPDGRRLYSVEKQDELIFWDTESGRREAIPLAIELGGQQAVQNWNRSVDVAPDGETIALGGTAGVIVCDVNGQVRYVIPNTAEGQPKLNDRDRLTFGGHYSTARFSPDGKLLAIVTSDSPQVLRLCDADDGQVLRRIELSAWLVRMAFSPDGKRIVATERDDSVRLYDVESGDRAWSHTVELSNPYETYTSAIAYSPDGTTIAAGATDHRIYLLDAETGKEVGRLEGHAWYPWGLEFTADGRTLYSSGWDGSIRRWDVAAREQLDLPAGVHATGIVAASPDGRLLAYATDRNLVEIVRAEDAAPVRKIETPGVQYSQLKFSPDSRRLAAGGELGNQVHVAVWNVSDGELLHRWDWPEGRDPHSKIECLDFTPDGAHLAAAVFRQSHAYVWSVSSGEKVADLPHPKVYGLSFSPDGQTLATSGWDKIIRFWETGSGKLRREFNVTDQGNPNADRRMYAVCYSRVGGLIAAADMESTIHVWRAEDMSLIAQCDVVASFTYGALEFSPDGLWVAAGSAGGKVSLWDPRTGENVWENTTGHEGYVYTVGFGRDSRTLLSGGEDGVCYVWDLRPRDVPADEDPAVWWDDLSGRSAASAFAAMWSLAAVPDRTIALLAERVPQQKSNADPESIRRWIAELDAPEFGTRKAAQAELAKVGAAAAEPLRKALAAAASPEQRGRLRKLLEDLEAGQETLAARRAVAVLDWIGTAEAEDVLRELAREDRDGIVGQAAAAALRN